MIRTAHRVLLKGGPRHNAEFMVSGDQVPHIESYGWDVELPTDIVGLADTAPTLGHRTRAHYHYHTTIGSTDLTPQPTLVLQYDAPVIRADANPENMVTTYRSPSMVGLPSLPGSAPTPGLPVVDPEATQSALNGRQYRPVLENIDIVDVGAGVPGVARPVRLRAAPEVPYHRPTPGVGQVSPVVAVDNETNHSPE